MTLNVHLHQLAYFREVARAESWSDAARSLHISQPALSQAMRELERRLGIALFERVGRRQVLTSTGRELASFASSLLAQSQAFAGRLEALQRGEAGRLRVGMVDAACLFYFPGALRAFQRESPDVELEVTVDASGPLLRKLRGFDLDLVIVVGTVEADDFRATSVVTEPMHIVKPAGSGEEPPRDARWLLYPSGSHTRRLIDAALAREGVVPNIVMESNNPQVLRQMVSMGFGWSVLPEPVIGDSPELARHRKKPLMRRELQAVTRADAPDDPRIGRLLGLL